MSRGPATAALLALALVHAGITTGAAGSQAATEKPKTWVSVIDQDERTTSSEIVDEEIRIVRSKRGTPTPFRTKERTDGRCEVEAGGYPHNPSAKDRWDGFWYEIYLVTPPPPGSQARKWKKVYTGDTVCIAPPIPKLPSATDDFRSRVADLIVLPAPTISISPGSEGITGLPVQLWAEGLPAEWLSFPPTVLDGKRIEIQARPTHFSWDTGDAGTSAPQSTYRRDTPGGPGSPAVTHVYETKSSAGRPERGTYTITLDVTWDRRYRVIGLSDPCNDWCELDAGRTTTSSLYRVVEVRGALIP
jgi:hypothetical protein